MDFSANHKTVLLLERGAYQLGDSGVEHDLNKLIKSRGDVGFPPLRKVTKSVWTCTVVSSMEYARMVWDIYPGEKLISFVVNSSFGSRLSSWDVKDQNFHVVMSTFAEVFRNQEVGVPDSGRALKAALGSLCYSTEAQKARLPASALPANRGRIVYFTHINNCGEVKKLKQTFQRAISDMRASEHDATLLSVDSCDLVVINVNKADEVSKAPDEKCELGPNCSFSLTAVSAVSLVDRVRCFAMEHFDLASLTVTGIPMKEEHHSNASTNYDVEVFYPKIAHRGQDKVDLQNTHKKSGYETLKLRWVAPPRGDANLTIPCHSVSRVTFAEVFSRPSNCLTNFIISGRVVMLEALMKDGSHSMSHMLSSRGGEIFIHSVMDRADNDDVACLTEGVGGKLTDYRSQDFADVIEGNLLAEWPGDVAVPPKMSGNAPELSTNLSSFIKHNVRRLKRFTAYFPLTLSATFLHSLRPHIDNLLLNMVKRVMSPSDVNEAKRIIYEIHQLEKKGELAHIFPSTAKSKSVKRDSQYKDVWDEIFVFVKAHQRSKGHREVLEALRMMRGSDGPDGSSDTNAERTSKRRLHDGATKHGKQIFTFTSDGKTLLEEWNARIIAEDHSRTREMPGKSRPGVAGERLYPAFNTNKEETEA